MDPVQEPMSVFTAIIPDTEPSAEPSAESTLEKTCDCKSCKKTVKMANIIICKMCDKDYDSDDYDEDEDEDDEDGESVKDVAPPAEHLFCKKCTRRCFVCEIRGCMDCVSTVCCDCSERMCRKCRNGDELCGCYGNCSSCGTDVNRGSDGWPCGECDKWLCSGCCRCSDNKCPECGPGEESEEDDE